VNINKLRIFYVANDEAATKSFDVRRILRIKFVASFSWLVAAYQRCVTVYYTQQIPRSDVR